MTGSSGTRKLGWYGLLLMLAISIVALLIGCSGGNGPAGLRRTVGSPANGVVTGTLAGKVTNSLTGGALVGVKITTDPAIQGVNIAADATGAYTAQLPVGVYTLSFKRDNFTPVTATASVVAGQTVTRNMVLKPTSPVVVSAGKDQEVAPGGTATLKATVEALDGSNVSVYQWTQIAGPPARMSSTTGDTITVTLDKAAAYKADLVKQLKFEDRFTVQGINPHALLAVERATFKVTVTASSGNYSGTVNVLAKLPYETTLGIQNVPMGVPVLLHGKKQPAYAWSIAGPAGSKAEFDEPSGQNPVFTPDFAGKYVITEKNSKTTMNVFAGTWSGGITGVDAKGMPVSAACTTCHDGKTAADQFTAWAKSGHAQIFSDNLATRSPYSESCYSCHAVGFDKAVKNGGLDDASDYAAFVSSGMAEKAAAGNWRNMLKSFPKSASLANIQCENCHGPNNGSTLHANNTIDAARVSISSEVCGSCHGEPPRHGRFQQWEESAHANFEAAIVEATVENRAASAGHCGRCHSGQGFLAWTKQGDDLTKRIQGKKGDATVDELKSLGLTKDTIQPITCVTCHDPHAQGTTSGEPNTSTVRIQGKTPLLPAGFRAENVGRGALCMTCHNTRNGLHNEANLATNYSAPHVAAQTDVLMGENAYFVAQGQRSSHGALKDTCATCHMEASPPPATFSYQGAGTNHGFKASASICGTCHNAAFDGEAFQTSFESRLHALGEAMSGYMMKRLPANLTIKDYTPHTSGGKSYDLKSDAVVIGKSDIASIEPTEPHGQQGFLVKFNRPVNVTYAPAGEAPHTVSVRESEVQLGDFTTDGKTPVIAVTDALVKAGWNYFLVHGDASKGVHNPTFVSQVLNASIAALN